MKVAILIPAFNEERTIGRVIYDVKEVMGSLGYKYEILVINDGSRDRTAAIAKDCGAIVYSHPINYGLAEAFRTGIKKCLELKADIIVHIDADGQYSAMEIPKLVSSIEEGYDLVLGSRFLGKIESMPFINRVGNLLFSRVVSNITRTRITDSQTGFRAFRRTLAEETKINSTHTYTQEQIIHAVKQKFRVKEVPIHFSRRIGKSRLVKNPVEYAAKALINVVRVYRDYEPLKFFGFIGTAFIGLGLLIGFWLIYLFLTTKFVGRTPSIVLCVLFISMGVQIITFGFLADMERK